MFRKFKEFLFGKEKLKQITEWYQISYTEGQVSSCELKETLEDALNWCCEQLVQKDIIHVYHCKEGNCKLRLTIKWE